MSMKRVYLATLSTVAVLAMTSGTLAQEARAFADKLSQTLDVVGGMDISFGSAVADGDTITLSEWSIPAVAGSRGEKLLDRTITFTGVTETGDGGYRAEGASIDDLDFTDAGVRLEVRNVELDNIFLPAEPGADTLESMRLYQNMRVGPIAVTLGDNKVFSIEAISVSSNYDETANTYDSGFEIAGIFGDVSMADDGDIQEILAVTGIQELNASMAGDFSWNLSEGVLNIKETSLSIDKIGRLNFALDLGGYTLELLDQIQAAGRELTAMDPSSDEYQMRSLQMGMGLVAGLSINSLAVRFDDDSITDKLLNLLMEKEEITRKQIISTAAVMVPGFLEMLGSPTLQEEITTAVVDYLKDPQNVEVSARPAEPVPFMVLAASVQDPAAAAELLNLGAIANQ